MKWYFQALRKYAIFSGRASRKEFWMFEFWNALILALVLAITAEADPSENFWPSLLPLAFFSLYGLATAIPALAGLVRRLHDTDHSGWWFFISVVPLVGPLVLLIFTIKDSDPGPNRFGPNPKTELANIPGPAMGYLAPPLPSSQEEGIMRSGLIDATGKRVLFWIFIIIILPLSVVLWRMVSAIGQTAGVEEPSYEEFKRQLDRGYVREATFYLSSNSYEIEGERLRPEEKFRLTLPNKEAVPDLVKEMRDKGVVIMFTDVSHSRIFSYRDIEREEVPSYDEFMNQVDRGNVREVTLYPWPNSYVIEGEWREPVEGESREPTRKFRLTLFKEAVPDLVKEMRDKGVVIHEKR